MRLHREHHMKVLAHNGVTVDANSKDAAQLPNAPLTIGVRKT